MTARMLVEGEIIRATDEFDTGTGGWHPVMRYRVGTAIDDRDEGYFQRPEGEEVQSELFEIL